MLDVHFAWQNRELEDNMESVVKFLRDKRWPISLRHAAAQVRSHVFVELEFELNDPHISVANLWSGNVLSVTCFRIFCH